MQQDKADMYIMANAKYFPAEKIYLVKDKIMAQDDSRMTAISSVEFKDPMTLLLISIFLGSFGVDRFMLGDVGLGIVKLLTMGGCGIWTIIDWFLIQGKTKERNFNAIMMKL
ncbi:MAG: TM2 domain-containing protein [Synergistaceae bacterium]|jgi:TM2 domain-containing membrane protein YozV|nr:TM2 domain-containing protein [Synergistaceae bacterium]